MSTNQPFIFKNNKENNSKNHDKLVVNDTKLKSENVNKELNKYKKYLINELDNNPFFLSF